MRCDDNVCRGRKKKAGRWRVRMKKVNGGGKIGRRRIRVREGPCRG